LAGPLGSPQGTFTRIGAAGGGYVQVFQGGVIAWSPGNGAHVLSGDMRAYFNSVGGIAGVPGWPTGPMVCSEGYCAQTFSGGVAYLGGGFSAFVDPRLVSAYAASGGILGALGGATTKTISLTASGGGLVQAFSGGAIAWTQGAGAVSIASPIREIFNEQYGGLAGSLGWPISQASCFEGLCQQLFQGGSISIWPDGSVRRE
jgi:uncharacterized protein with LGFP repeats